MFVSSDHSTATLVILLLVGLAVAAYLSLLACRSLLRAQACRDMPRPILCSLLWTTPTAIFLSVPLLLLVHLPSGLELLLFVPISAMLGMLYGASYQLVIRIGNALGTWPERLLIGALLGLVLALVVGVAVHLLLTGWGGPGGGSFQRANALNVSIYFSWLIPLFAVLGCATPRAALMRDPPRTDLNRWAVTQSRPMH